MNKYAANVRISHHGGSDYRWTLWQEMTRHDCIRVIKEDEHEWNAIASSFFNRDIKAYIGKNETIVNEASGPADPVPNPDGSLYYYHSDKRTGMYTMVYSPAPEPTINER
jgi:hypothetical protein